MNPPPAETFGGTRPMAVLDPRDGAAVVEYTDGSMQRLGAGGPLQAGVVCLLRRDSLTAIDPVTGRKLWVRTDITSRSHVFGDGQNIYVVALDPKGNAAGTSGTHSHAWVAPQTEVRIRPTAWGLSRPTASAPRGGCKR